MTTVIDAKGALSRFRMKQDQERQERQRLEAAAAAEERAEREKAEAERRRLELIALRDQRLEREAFQNLNDAERAELNKQLPDLSKIAQQARKNAESDYAAQIEREYLEELKQARVKGMAAGRWRPAGPEAHAVLVKAEQNKKAKFDAYLKTREDRELQAEIYDDEIERVLASLDDTGRGHLGSLIKQEPSRMECINQTKQTVAQRDHAAKQAELRPQYEAEVQKLGKLNVTASRRAELIADVKIRYKKKGLEVW